MRRNLKFLIAYDGTRYAGWQDNGQEPSIEGELSRALAQLLQHPVELQAASRTDRGVHAEGQQVNAFTTSSMSPFRLLRALNGLLPPDIRVREVSEADLDWHPTLDASGKIYHYRLATSPVQLPHHRHLSWHVPQPLDLDWMGRSGEQLIGTHDFTALSNRRKGEPTDRRRWVTRIEFESWEGGLLIAIEGQSFLYKMVRNMVGTLVEVGLGKRAPDLSKLLDGADRPEAGVTAPAHGLTLHRILDCI